MVNTRCAKKFLLISTTLQRRCIDFREELPEMMLRRVPRRWSSMINHPQHKSKINFLYNYQNSRMFWWSDDEKTKQTTEEVATAEVVKDEENKLVAQFGESLPKINPIIVAPLVRRPIFPGFFATHLIKNQETIDAIMANQTNGASYLGLFMRADDVMNDESKAELVTSTDQLHNIGSFAQIHNIIKSPRGAQLMLMVHRRISLEEITKFGPPTIAKVTHLKSPSFTIKSPAIKAYSNEVMGAVRELLKINPVAQEHIHEWASRMDFSDPFKLADFAASMTSADGEELQRVLSSLVIFFIFSAV